MLDTQVTDTRDWLQLATPTETPLEIAASNDPLLPGWLRTKSGEMPRMVVDIIDAVARHRGLTRTEIRADRRCWRIVRPRHEAIYWAARLTTMSLPAIARQFGGKDHTTILHAIRKHAKLSGLPSVNNTDRYLARLRRIAEQTAADKAERQARILEKRRLSLEQGRATIAADVQAQLRECARVAKRWCSRTGRDFETTINSAASIHTVARHELWFSLHAKGFQPSIIAKATKRSKDAVRVALRRSRAREAV